MNPTPGTTPGARMEPKTIPKATTANPATTRARTARRVATLSRDRMLRAAMAATPAPAEPQAMVATGPVRARAARGARAAITPHRARADLRLSQRKVARAV